MSRKRHTARENHIFFDVWGGDSPILCGDMCEEYGFFSGWGYALSQDEYYPELREYEPPLEILID